MAVALIHSRLPANILIFIIYLGFINCLKDVKVFRIQHHGFRIEQ
jgi:hypothetical protein